MPSSKRAIAMVWTPAILWMGVIFWLSSFPRFDFVPERWQIEPVSLTVHALEYALLAALLWLAARRTPGLAQRAWQASLLIALFYAASDELHQAFVPGRFADVRDWLADAAGAAAAVWLLQWRAHRAYPCSSQFRAN